MHRTTGFAVAALTLLLTSPTQADSLLRCGTELVSEGASPYEVRMTCGDPVAEARRTEYRTRPRVVLVPCTPGGSAQCRQIVQETVEVQVLEWTYDNGPQRFIRYVTFEQDRLIHVRTGGRGHKR